MDQMSYRVALARAIEWRVVALLIDFTISYAVTGLFTFSVGLTSLSNVVRTIVHALWIRRRGHD